ncbi:hypothetical protein HDA32_001122 [Spinactinospora alkalitolerans]|uniref:Uncharacterized protein n=1 Tax=Spinactinospora alkalitolerans TaxID=687207 RepID=A0A852TT23_9ACTN|nr:hypothetical protein [Spinactinospora alkalitolerans]NYE46002.1 hypothetical protein [Spinactinospora alkalitolerans]
MLFLDPTNIDANDIVTAVASWNMRYIHESSHWARFHGSTIGVLLTLLRRTRDVLAAHTLQNLDTQDIVRFSRGWSTGVPIFDYSDTDPENRLGTQLSLHQQDWLDLHMAYQILLEPRFLSVPAHSWATRESVQSALHIIWVQSEEKEMLPRLPSERGGPRILGQMSLVAGNEGLLSTRLLLECAAVLDEVTQQTGTFNRYADPALLRMLGKVFDSEYGIPYRFAEYLAGRELDPITVMAMIDFALNPVVPGLHSREPEVEWQEFHPPSRFISAARAASSLDIRSFTSWPSAQSVNALHQEIVHRTGLRMGKVVPTLSSASSIRECATRVLHYAQRVPEVTLFYSADLMHERSKDPSLISHYGMNFVGPGALRLVDPEQDVWSIFPPLRVTEGRYGWPAEDIDIDEATTLLIGSAISSAYDDAVHGLGAPSLAHLPADEFKTDEQISLFNEELTRAVRLPLSWPM